MESYREYVIRRIDECKCLEDWVDPDSLGTLFTGYDHSILDYKDLKELLDDIITTVQCANSEDM